MIEIQLQRNEIEVGQSFSGQFYWTGNKTAEEISFEIRWRTKGLGDVDSETLYSNSFAGTTSSAFSCTIPALGPVSYDGQLIQIIWEAIVEVRFPGLFGGMEKEVKVFRVIPKRWVVERTFAWLSNFRRLSKDYERQTETSEVFIQIAMIKIMA